MKKPKHFKCFFLLQTVKSDIKGLILNFINFMV